SRYDIDGLTLGELPGLVLAGIRAACSPAPSHSGDEALDRLRRRVALADREELTQLVLDARAAYGLRDENGPYNVTWPNGLLRRLGVGGHSYTGRARVARTPEDALATLEPGDVLVTPMTTPAYNAVLPLAGALVVEEGGALCHAAVIARELDIPTLVGVGDALTLIGDGD